MATVNVKVPDEMKNRIKELAEENHYQNESEYVRDAIRKKMEEDTGLSIKEYRDVLERIKDLEDRKADVLSEEEVKEVLGLK